MLPTMKNGRPTAHCHKKCSSQRPSKVKKTISDRRICKAKAPSQTQRIHTLARRSNRGEAGIRGHESIGRYRTEITSSQGKRCGVFALEISTSRQLYGLVLTPKVWDKFFHSEASKAWHQKKGWVGPDYQQEFFDEQLSLILYMWGREHGKTLQLGVAADGQDPFVVPLPELEDNGERKTEDGTLETVWIHNDNAQLILGRPCNHYSGITILGPFAD